MIIPDEACKIWISNREELYEFLSACQNRGIRWISGREALYWYNYSDMGVPMGVCLSRQTSTQPGCLTRVSDRVTFSERHLPDITAEFFADVKMPDPHTVLEAAWI